MFEMQCDGSNSPEKVICPCMSLDVFVLHFIPQMCLLKVACNDSAPCLRMDRHSMEKLENKLHDESGGAPAPAACPQPSATELRLKNSVALPSPERRRDKSQSESTQGWEATEAQRDCARRHHGHVMVLHETPRAVITQDTALFEQGPSPSSTPSRSYTARAKPDAEATRLLPTSTWWWRGRGHIAAAAGHFIGRHCHVWTNLRVDSAHLLYHTRIGFVYFPGLIGLPSFSPFSCLVSPSILP